MRQLLQNMRTGETYVADVPIPVAREGTALVQTQASLVSAGTERMVVEFAEKSLVAKARSRPDLVRQVVDKARREGVLSTVEAAFNKLDQPMVLGYSSAGIITAVGNGLRGFRVGDRVACAGGGHAVHAEFARVPQNLLAHIPDGVDYEKAAFATLGAIAMHGFRLSGVQLGEKVAVIGLGLLGLLAAGITRAAGCRVLGIDVNAERVALGGQMGVFMAVSREDAGEAAAAFSRGRGVDAVLICADTPSNDPVELAGIISRDRARVVAVGAVGLELPRKLYYEKELFFVNSRSYGPGRYDPEYEEAGKDYPSGYVRWTEGRNLQAVLDLMADGGLDVSPLISHRYPIENAPEAYELITGKRNEPFMGVVLTYPAAAEIADRLSGTDGKENTPEVQTSTLANVPAVTPVDEVRLGVLGAGNFATAVMLPAVKKIEGIRLISVTSGSGVSAQHAAQKFGFQRTAASNDEIFGDGTINTVAVLTRHNLHAAQVITALQANKHVFCEKPLAIRSEEVDNIEAVLQSAGALLTVGYNRRFAPLAVRLKGFFAGRQEALAAFYRVNAGYLPLTHWLHDAEVGGGRIIGEGCHFIDFLSYLVGEPPVTVAARALPDEGRYREDNVLLTFGFADGSLGTVQYLANGDKTFAKERVEVFCGGRAAALDDFRTLELSQGGRREVHRSALRQDKGHAAIWETFSRAIIHGGQPPIPYEELLGVSRAALAAVEAVKSGKIVHISI